MRSKNTKSGHKPTSVVLAPVRPMFRAVTVTVVPEAQQLDEASWDELEQAVEQALRDRRPALLKQLRFFLRAIQWLPVFRYGQTFTSLSPAQRLRILSYLQDHPVKHIRCGLWGLRTLVFLGYYGRPGGVEATGYCADPRGWEALK
jgi:hypothetical protein